MQSWIRTHCLDVNLNDQRTSHFYWSIPCIQYSNRRSYLCPSKNFNIEKCWDSAVFALFCLNLAMLQNFPLSHTFSGFFFEKSRQKRPSLNICLCFLKNTCVFYYINFWKHLEKSWDLVCFALTFQKT